jgi:hypothetical protein
MPRWSDAMQLASYRDYADILQDPGVYELGFVQSGVFHQKYIGKATGALIDRIKTYAAANGQTSHCAAVRDLSPAAFHQVRFHVMRLDSGDRAAVREALMLVRHGYGWQSAYPWNSRYELETLRQAGYAIRDVKPRG